MPDYFGNKISWTICLICSIVYFVLFEAVATERVEAGLLFGFCVWGTPDIPNDNNGCSREPSNSHMYAFYIDVAFTSLVGLLYLLQKEAASKVQFLAIGGIILSHGFMHFALFEFLDCYIDPEKLPFIVTVIGYIVFAVFTFALSVVILSFGFVSDNGWRQVQLVSAGVTAIVVLLALLTGSEWLLPALFAISHPLSSVTGLYSTSPTFSYKMGWAFLVATLTGILELTTCPSFYRRIGGHYWYDVTLHIAVVMSLPPFVPNTSRPKAKAD